MTDFKDFSNPIVGFAQSFVTQGDLVFVESKKGLLQCEALTDIKVGEVVVFKDINGKYWAVGERSQAVNQETTQFFKSRLQEKRVGKFEIVTIFSEIINTNTELVNPAFKARLNAFLSSNDATDDDISNYSEVKDVSVKYWMKINSVVLPIELKTYSILEYLTFLWDIDDKFIYVTFKSGYIEESQKGYIDSLDFFPVLDGTPDPGSDDDSIRANNVNIAYQINILIFNYQGKKLKDIIFTLPEEITFTKTNYYSHKYAYNYGTNTSPDYLLGEFDSDFGSRRSAWQSDTDFYNQPSACFRQIRTTINSPVNIGYNYLERLANVNSPSNINFAGFTRGISTIIENALLVKNEYQTKFVPNSRPSYNLFKNTVYRSNTFFTDLQVFPMNEAIENNNLEMVKGIQIMTALTETTYLKIREYSIRNYVDTTIAPFEAVTRLFDPSRNPVVYFFIPRYAADNPDNPDNQFCATTEIKEYFTKKQRLVPENFTAIDLNKVNAIYGQTIFNSYKANDRGKRPFATTPDVRLFAEGSPNFDPTINDFIYNIPFGGQL